MYDETPPPRYSLTERDEAPRGINQWAGVQIGDPHPPADCDPFPLPLDRTGLLHSLRHPQNRCLVIHNCQPPYMRYNGVRHYSMPLSPISFHSPSHLTQTRAYGAVFSVIPPMNDSPEQPSPCLALVPVDPPGKVSNAGRPTVMTPEIIDKLEYVFAFGGTDKEACLFAGLGMETLYNYQRNHPEFAEQKDLLKSNPILLARMTLVKELGNIETAKWFLTRKRRNEFTEKPKEEPPAPSSVNVAVFNDTIDEAKIQRLVTGLAERIEERLNRRGVRSSEAVPGSGMAIPSEAES